MSPLILHGYRESAGELILPEGGLVRTGAARVELVLDWPESAGAEVTGGLYDGDSLLWEVGPAEGRLLGVPLPAPFEEERSLELRLTAGAATATVPVRLKRDWPKIEALYASSIVCSAAGLYFTLAFRVRGDLTGGRSLLGAMAGFGPDPTLPGYGWRGVPEALAPGGFYQAEVKLEQPQATDFIFLAAAVLDRWGNSDVVRLSLALPQLLTMGQPPSRLEYDHSTQELVNTFPIWTASRARDYLALANDPNYTMRGLAWRWLGELKDYFVPYDFTFAPLTQRLFNGALGQHAGEIRSQISALERSFFLLTADAGMPGHIWSAPLTEYTLLSCVLLRRWLYVLGRHETTGQARLFVVDPASPAPLQPESCLWCESAFELPLLGVSALARSLDRQEVFVQ